MTMCIAERLKSSLLTAKNSVCIHYEQRIITYSQLHDDILTLQSIFTNYSPGPLLINVPRSYTYHVAVIAAMLSTRPFIPIATEYSRPLINKIIEDTGASLMISAGAANGLETLQYEELPQSAIAKQSAISSDVIAIFYSSGSTGTPKGVKISESALLNRFDWMLKTFPYGAEERQLVKTNRVFIDSLWEYFGPIFACNECVIASDEDVKDIRRLLMLSQSKRVTRITAVPSYLRALLSVDSVEHSLGTIKFWLVSGEVFDGETASVLLQRYPGSTVLNLYGSTEVMGDVACHQVTQASLESSSIPIGEPLPNTELFLLDENNLNTVVQDEHMGRGVLSVAGKNVSPGYINAQLTRDAFKTIDINGSRRRIFITNDLCEYKDGIYRFICRMNREVKIRGIKVNLDYVESEIKTVNLSHVSNIFVYANNNQIVCVLEMKFIDIQVVEVLRKNLDHLLPKFAQPTQYDIIEQFPKTYTGKIDTKQLQIIIAAKKAMTNSAECTNKDKLLSLFREITDNPALSATDNVFAHGLTSLNVIQVTVLARKQLNVDIPVKLIFSNQTVEKIKQACGL